MVDTEDIRKDAAPEEEVQETAAESEEKEDTAQKKNDKSEEAAKKEPEEDSDTRYMRLMADFQNYKKRVEKEKKDLYSYANEKLVTELLDVLDNFERALDQEGQGDSFKEGMEMIFKQLGGCTEEVRSGRNPGAGGRIRPEFPQRCDERGNRRL